MSSGESASQPNPHRASSAPTAPSSASPASAASADADAPTAAALTFCASPAFIILAILGLGLLTASNLMLLNGFSPATAPAGSTEGAGAATFASVFHIGELLAFTGGMAASGVALALVGRRRNPLPWLPLLLTGGAFAFIGLAALWMKQGIDPANLTIPDALLCGAPIGAGNGLLFALWARVFNGLSPRAAVVGAATAVGFGIAASTLVPLALGHAHQVETWMTIQLGTCLAAAGALRKETPGNTEDDAADPAHAVPAAASADTTPPSVLGRATKGSRTENLLAVLGLALFFFVLGVYWRSFSTAIFYSELLEGVVALVASALVAGAALLLRGRPRSVFRIVLPLGAVLLLADPFLSFDGARPMAPSGASWTVCLVVFLAAGYDAVFSRVAQSGRTIRTAGAAQALWSVGLLAGVLSGEVTDPYGFKLVVTAVMVLFLAALLVSYARHPADEARQALAPAPAPEPATPTAEDIVRRAADAYHLSVREAEVLGYLIQGRGEAYIAEALFISVSTVKTHRKNIYRKMNLGGREELLDWYARQ